MNQFQRWVLRLLLFIAEVTLETNQDKRKEKGNTTQQDNERWRKLQAIEKSIDDHMRRF